MKTGRLWAGANSGRTRQRRKWHGQKTTRHNGGAVVFRASVAARYVFAHQQKKIVVFAYREKNYRANSINNAYHRVGRNNRFSGKSANAGDLGGGAR